MKKKLLLSAAGIALLLFSPFPALCQNSAASGIRGLQQILKDLYKEMLPLCGDLVSIGQALAGFAALFYIGSRIWKSIASAEAIDFYPLFRPFVIGFCIMNFPLVIGCMNGLLEPTVTGTEAVLDSTNKTVHNLMEKRKQAMDTSQAYLMYGVNNGGGNKDLWMYYTQTEQDRQNDFLGIGASLKFSMSKIYYNMKNWFKNLLATLLEILYEAAALCINTIRTFNLLIMALLGPIVFGLSIFDGFQHTLQVYIAKYINFYLWLPIANILSALLAKIQAGMIKLDIQQINQYGDSFFSTSDIGYLIFMIIGIVAYFTIPNLSNLVVNSGGGSLLTSKIGGMSRSVVTGTFGAATKVAGNGLGMASDALGDANRVMTTGFGGAGSDYFADKIKG